MCKGTHIAMKRDTASNAALSAADFCKVQFERYLDSLGFTRKVRWIEGGGRMRPRITWSLMDTSTPWK